MRLSAHRRGIGAGGWGPGGGGAASLWAAPGRGLSAVLRPPAVNADSESCGCPQPHPEPSGVPGGNRAPPPYGVQGTLPGGHRPSSVGYAKLTVPSGGLSSGGARIGAPQLWSVPGDGGHDGGRMGANNGKQYGSEGEWADSPHTPGSRPLPSPSPGEEGSCPLRRCTPLWQFVRAVTFPFGTECSGARGCFPTVGVPLSNFPGCLRDGSSCIAAVFLNACASTFPSRAFGL